MAVEWGFKDFREFESVAGVCTGSRIASLQSRDFKLPLWLEGGKCKMNKLAGTRGLFPNKLFKGFKDKLATQSRLPDEPAVSTSRNPITLY